MDGTTESGIPCASQFASLDRNHQSVRYLFLASLFLFPISASAQSPRVAEELLDHVRPVEFGVVESVEPSAETANPNRAAEPVKSGNRPWERPAGASPDLSEAAKAARRVGTGAEVLTEQAIESKLAEAEKAASLSDEQKKQIADIYKEALTLVRSAAQLRTKANTFRETRRRAPADAEQLRKELSQPLIDVTVGMARDVPITEIERSLTEAQGRLNFNEKRAAELEREPKRRAERRQEIPKQVQAIEEKKQAVEKTPVPREPPELTAAWQALLTARRLALEQEAASLDQEALSYEAQNELLPLQRDRVARAIAHARKQIKTLDELLLIRRRQDAEDKAQEAQRAAATAHPAVQALALQNSQLANLRTGDDAVVRRIEKITAEHNQVVKLLSEVQADFQRLTDQVTAGGLTDAIGQRLRRQRSQLPDLDRYRHNRETRRHETNRIQLELLDLEDRRTNLADTDLRVQEIFAHIDSSTSPEEYQNIELAIKDLVERQREFLQDLINDHAAYAARLTELDAAENDLIATTQKYQRFIDENVLWIRSAAPLSSADVIGAWRTFDWLFDPDRWIAVLSAVRSRVLGESATAILTAALFATLIVFQRRLRRELGALGDAASKGTSASFHSTAKAAVVTALIAGTWPVLAWCFGHMLTHAAVYQEFPQAFGKALQAVGGAVFAIELVRQICRPGGLADAHFDWPPAPLRALRRCLGWSLFIIVPVVFFITITEFQSVELYKTSVGRLTFLAGMGLFSGVILLWFQPGGTIVRSIVASAPEGWLAQTAKLWHGILAAIPLALAGLAGLGYYYTALQLCLRLHNTILLATAVVFGQAMVLRWLMISRRKLALQRWRERRNNQAAETNESGIPLAGAPGAEQTAAELAKIHGQTKQLMWVAAGIALALGFWVVWSDVVPALSIFDRYELYSVTLSAAEAAKEGTPLRVITLGSFLLAVAVAAIALLAGKNVPGLLAITVLQRLPIDNGIRYAVTTLCRYVILMGGIVLVAGRLGASWDRVQWLLAAVSVGLGFGLQEIFANFVSGIILLFERPIRVGDIVTVGDTSGIVAQIHMRATTIINWDRKEFIVPNKEFITGQVLNWTLSDRTTRVVVNVGVAYGTDTGLARKILLRVANEHPHVAKDPAPQATFETFGDNSLNYVLRCFVPAVEKRLDVTNDLHERIHEEYRDAGIEIAFPQRDLHIRSVKLPERHQSFDDPLATKEQNAGAGNKRGTGRMKGDSESAVA